VSGGAASARGNCPPGAMSSRTRATVPMRLERSTSLGLRASALPSADTAERFGPRMKVQCGEVIDLEPLNGDYRKSFQTLPLDGEDLKRKKLAWAARLDFNWTFFWNCSGQNRVWALDKCAMIMFTSKIRNHKELALQSRRATTSKSETTTFTCAEAIRSSSDDYPFLDRNKSRRRNPYARRQGGHCSWRVECRHAGQITSAPDLAALGSWVEAEERLLRPEELARLVLNRALSQRRQKAACASTS